MIPSFTARRSILLAGTIAGLFLAAPVFAQSPALLAARRRCSCPARRRRRLRAAARCRALPPGSPLIGRPEGNEAAAKLAPVAAPPLPAAADKLPTASSSCRRASTSRSMPAASPMRARCASATRAPCSSAPASATRSPPSSRRTARPRSRSIAVGLYRPNGLAYHNGTLYIAELSQISKIENVEDKLDKPPKPTVIYTDLPKDEAHGWKFIAIGPDNKLYIPVGQPGNNVLHDKDHGQIRRINLDGTGRETSRSACATRSASTGIRSTSSSTSPTTAATGCPRTCREDELNRVTKVGEDFGAPYCYQGNLPDPEFGWGHKCSDYTPPIVLTGPHSAGLGHALLHRQHVPDEVQERDLPRPPRLVEQVEQVRRRRRRRASSTRTAR